MEKLFYIMSNLETHYHLKLDFQKVDQHTGDKWPTAPSTTLTISCKAWNSLVVYRSTKCKYDMKESECNMLEYDIQRECLGTETSRSVRIYGTKIS